MRVCLDARCIREVMTGIGRYAEQLIRGLAEIDKVTEYVVILNSRYEGTLVDQPNFTVVRFPRPSRPDTVSGMLASAFAVGKLDIDMYHSLHHFLPFGIKGKVVLTLHDLIPIDYPYLTSSNWLHACLVKAWSLVRMRHSLTRADHIIMVSNFTAHRAKAFIVIDDSRMTVISHGVDERFFKAGNGSAGDGVPAPALPSARMNNAPFFLCVGIRSRHKNIERVITALALLRERYPEMRLLLVGGGVEYDRLVGQTLSPRLADRVTFLKDASDNELIATLKRAVGLVFPSIVEGFGMPILEAQAIGCPVITSDRGAMLETSGNAALHVDPLDPWSIARAMETLYTDTRLRSALIERGRKWAANFTWRETAARTREVYERLRVAEPVMS